MTLAISGHGALIQRAPAATPSTFTTIAEMGDITAPGFTRNDFEAITQDRNIDAYILGVLRRQPLQISLNFLPGNATHDHLTGLVAAMITEPPPTDGFKLIPTGGGAVWVMSGQVKEVANIKYPVDGKVSADVTIRLSDKMWIGSTLVG